MEESEGKKKKKREREMGFDKKILKFQFFINPAWKIERLYTDIDSKLG